MFTGIVTHTARVERIEGEGGRRVELVPESPLPAVAVGASIAHAGICLTVASLTETGWRVEISHETLARTTARHWRAGQRVNLECSLRLGDELGGHLVFGHVDGVGAIRSIEPRGLSRHVVIGLPGELVPLTAVKGSIAVDGISLTVNEVGADWFAVTIVPHTWQHTTLGACRPDDPVNLEADMLARYVARQLDCRAKGASSV